MNDQRPDLDRYADDEAARSWLAGPRVVAWPRWRRLVMALVVATVVVGFATAFVVFLDSRADAPSSGAVLFTALFMAVLAYGYAVHWAFDPKRAVRSATRRNAAYPTSAPGGYRVEDRDDRS